MKNVNMVLAIAIMMTIAACGSGNHQNTSDSSSSVDDNQALIACENQNDELSRALDGYRLSDSIRYTDEAIYRELEDSLSKINLSPLGILPMWNGKKVDIAAKMFEYDTTLAGSVYPGLCEIFSETGYVFLRKAFIASPAVWQKVFLSEQSRIAWFKKKLNLAPIDENILPYLKDEDIPDGMKKMYAPYFKKFYALHAPSSTDGVWYHPKWQEFEDEFFKKFPDAFGGDRSEFGQAYKDWRTAHTIPAPAKKVLASLIEQYNQL